MSASNIPSGKSTTFDIDHNAEEISKISDGTIFTLAEKPTKRLRKKAKPFSLEDSSDDDDAVATLENVDLKNERAHQQMMEAKKAMKDSSTTIVGQKVDPLSVLAAHDSSDDDESNGKGENDDSQVVKRQRTGGGAAVVGDNGEITLKLKQPLDGYLDNLANQNQSGMMIIQLDNGDNRHQTNHGNYSVRSEYQSYSDQMAQMQQDTTNKKKKKKNALLLDDTTITSHQALSVLNSALDFLPNNGTRSIGEKIDASELNIVAPPHSTTASSTIASFKPRTTNVLINNNNNTNSSTNLGRVKGDTITRDQLHSVTKVNPTTTAIDERYNKALLKANESNDFLYGDTDSTTRDSSTMNNNNTPTSQKSASLLSQLRKQVVGIQKPQYRASLGVMAPLHAVQGPLHQPTTTHSLPSTTTALTTQDITSFLVPTTLPQPPSQVSVKSDPLALPQPPPTTAAPHDVFYLPKPPVADGVVWDEFLPQLDSNVSILPPPTTMGDEDTTTTTTQIPHEALPTAPVLDAVKQEPPFLSALLPLPTSSHTLTEFTKLEQPPKAEPHTNTNTTNLKSEQANSMVFDSGLDRKFLKKQIQDRKHKDYQLLKQKRQEEKNDLIARGIPLSTLVKITPDRSIFAFIELAHLSGIITPKEVKKREEQPQDGPKPKKGQQGKGSGKDPNQAAGDDNGDDSDDGIDLTQRDEMGNVLTQKEAFKQQSRIFHGKGENAQKLEKKRDLYNKRIAESQATIVLPDGSRVTVPQKGNANKPRDPRAPGNDYQGLTNLSKQEMKKLQQEKLKRFRQQQQQE